MRLLIFLTFLALLALPAVGSARASPRLDAAVAAYEKGQLKTARIAFERLARQKVPAADYNLAVMHLRGEMPRPSTREALRLMTRAANAGFVTAMTGLGELYEQGAPGILANAVQARHWHERAADAGSVESQLAVATAHYLGRGAPLDKAVAARRYRQAAQAGDVGAQYLYAAMLEAGDGIAQDLHEARYWFSAAARGGDEAAPFKVKELDARLAALPKI